MLYIVQPYYLWPGHNEYLKCLLSNDSMCIYCGKKDQSLTNGVRLTGVVSGKGIVNFLIGRVLNSFIAVLYLLWRTKRSDTVHFVEVEPCALVLFLLANLVKPVKIILTVHSLNRIQYIDKTTSINSLKMIVNAGQVILYRMALSLANVMGTTFVVHSKADQEGLQKWVKEAHPIIIAPPSESKPEPEPARSSMWSEVGKHYQNCYATIEKRRKYNIFSIPLTILAFVVLCAFLTLLFTPLAVLTYAGVSMLYLARA